MCLEEGFMTVASKLHKSEPTGQCERNIGLIVTPTIGYRMISL